MPVSKIPFWKSFTSLLFVVYGVTTVLLITLFTILVFENQVDLIAENAMFTALRTGIRIRSAAESHALISGTEDLDVLLSRLKDVETEDSDIMITDLRVFDDHGYGLFPEAGEPSNLEDTRDIQTAITKRDFESRLFHHRVNIRDREVILFIPFANEEEQAVVRATLAVPQIDDRLDYLRRQAFIMLAAVLILHGGFIFFVYRVVIRPFNALSRSVDRIARGDFDAPVPHFRAVEFSRLSEEMQRMSYAVRDMQDSARSANPLTSLPGNVEIERQIRARIEKNEPFCVLYGDLDNFKSYNDSYGFSKGDEVILYTKNVLLKAAEEYDVSEVFIGHQGGDDFVLTSRFSEWESLAATCTNLFDAGIGAYYSEADRKAGYIESVDRRGNTGRFPLTSISVAVVTNHHRKIESIGEVAKIAAELKKYVKSIEGSAYAIDRRID